MPFPSMSAQPADTVPCRHDWSRDEIRQLLTQPFADLLWQAQQVHRQCFDANRLQLSTLLSVKTGACPEDCAYCPQSAHYSTGLSQEKLMQVEQVLEQARQAQAGGAERFCMGAAFRSPHERDMPALLAMVRGVKALGMETCMTLGMLSADQAVQLAAAGLDYYNHNLDTSPEYYGEIITTRSYADRLLTLQHVRDAGMNVCSGGILGLGEQQSDRIGLLQQLANLPQHPESVPLNQLVAVAGTPLGEQAALDPLEFVRVVAVARILMPRAYLRLSAGREHMSDAVQALCYLAGINSVFSGECLLTTPNPDAARDQALFARLGVTAGRPMAEQPLYYDATAI